MAKCARRVILALSAMCFAPPAYARCVPMAEMTDSASGALGAVDADRMGRVVAPVHINGQGPFRFIVDTGANRSVISVALAERLSLQPQGQGDVHFVHGVASAPLVSVDTLNYGQLRLGGVNMPVLDGGALAGEDGLLGVDGMDGRRLRFDFERQCIEIAPSRQARRLYGWAEVRGELRFGHLIVINGFVSGVPTRLLVDTGSDTSLANNALREALNARIQRDRSRLDFAVGGPVLLDRAIFLRRIIAGELEVRDVLAFVDDFHVFRVWDLLDEPTLLIGMDVISQARGIAIDYERGVVFFDVRPPRRENSGSAATRRPAALPRPRPGDTTQ